MRPLGLHGCLVCTIYFKRSVYTFGMTENPNGCSCLPSAKREFALIYSTQAQKRYDLLINVREAYPEHPEVARPWVWRTSNEILPVCNSVAENHSACTAE